jgi:hypothetical protein
MKYILRHTFTSKQYEIIAGTERHGRVVNNPASYAGGPGFKSQPGDWLAWLRISVAFLSLSRQMPR